MTRLFNQVTCSVFLVLPLLMGGCGGGPSKQTSKGSGSASGATESAAQKVFNYVNTDEPKHLDPAYLRSIEDAQIHGTITPPGADNAHATSELAPYDDLVQAYPKLTPDRLKDFFKLRTLNRRTHKHFY